ncbi:major outer membrane protein [Campylobacter sp. TTU-622]|uniref:major outer membrane protein n=1 Tax=Campylobacter sp. TTU-622 TaxID=2800583 RepID=UPI0019038037|nr:major outer membrane protein [Campylobacter sp. TTU-622]MBK1973859.1 major outer membrane protein [Campylobacter sp. TTU-622]
MKLKSILYPATALLAFSYLNVNAAPLEEAIKDIDVSGTLRYRYDSASGNFRDHKRGFLDDVGEGYIKDKQMHNYKAQINFSGAIADNFKLFIQFNYSAKDGGYGVYDGNPTLPSGAVNPNYNPNISDTQTGFSVRQLYLTYAIDDFNTNIILGKQQLNTIWTDNSIDGLVGTGVKIINNSFDHLSFVAFAIDSFGLDEQPNDFYANAQYSLDEKTYNENLYGGAMLGNYELLGGNFNPELWLSYLNNSFLFYAFKFNYNVDIFNDINWNLQGAYLGNQVIGSSLKDLGFTKSNFFALKGTIAINSIDASLGGVYYGDKNSNNMVVIEDQGNLKSLLAGEEIFYSDGSKLNGDTGENLFAFASAGYTFNEVLRLGADFVYGGTKSGDISAVAGRAGKKLESVARIDYKYSPKLTFRTWYSYAKVKALHDEGEKNTVRLEALYKF